MIYAGVGVIGGSGLAMFESSSWVKPLWFAGYLARTSFGLVGVITIIITAELEIL